MMAKFQKTNVLRVDMKDRLLHTTILLLIAIFSLVLSGCENNFQPLKENNDFIFSIYGYLEASADTQWVRVSPARKQLEMPHEVPDMEVTLEHMETGDIVVMNDSLFSENGAHFLNFWTTMEIKNGQTYRLKAEKPDGASSQATVTIPDEFSTPRVQKVTRFWGQPPAYKIYISDVNKLVDLRTIWYVRIAEEKKKISFKHRDKVDTVSSYGGSYSVSVVPEDELQEIESHTLGDDQIEVLHKQFYVVSGGPEWNEEITLTDDLVYTLPGSISNVENGLGYMVGIDSKVIPYESCYDDQEELIPCPEEEAYW